MTKYKEALEMFDRMTRGIPAKRPDCMEILNEKQIWSLDEKGLFSAQRIETIVDLVKQCNSCPIFVILKKKLGFAYDKKRKIYFRKQRVVE
jgi:hypothetical protein